MGRRAPHPVLRPLRRRCADPPGGDPAADGARARGRRLRGRTDFVAQWESRPEAAREEAESLRGAIMASVAEERPHELTPFTGQSAGLIHELAPAAEIVRTMVADAERALGHAARLRGG